MTTKITTTARALRELLTPVLGLADKGDTLPILECIRLRGHGSTMSAQATDRYVAGMARASIAAPDGFQALLPLSSAKALLATFKVSRGHDPELELTFADDAVTVETAGLSDAIAGARIGFRLGVFVGRDYPELDEVLREAFKATGQAETNVSGALLESFKGALRDGHPMRLWHNGLTRPTGIAIGDHFRGCIMPVRIADGEPGPLEDGWGPLLGVETATEAVSA